MKDMVAKVKAGKGAKHWASVGTTNESAVSASKESVNKGKGSGFIGGPAASVMKSFCGKKK